MHEETPKVCNRDVSMASSESMQNPPIPKLVTLVRNDQLHRVPAAKGEMHNTEPSGTQRTTFCHTASHRESTQLHADSRDNDTPHVSLPFPLPNCQSWEKGCIFLHVGTDCRGRELSLQSGRKKTQSCRAFGPAAPLLF